MDIKQKLARLTTALQNIRNHIKTIDLKNRKHQAIIITAAVLLISGICLFFYQPNKKSSDTVSQEKVEKPLIINIALLGNLDAPQISPRQVKVEKGEMMLLHPPKERVRKINFLGHASTIDFAEIITFTVPGKRGKFWLADSLLPTLVECDESGYITFDVSYPSLLADFDTAKKIEGKYIVGAAISLKIEKDSTKLKASNFGQPRQIARPKGMIGGMAPDLAVEKLPRQFDLRGEAQKGLPETVEKAKKVWQTKGDWL